MAESSLAGGEIAAALDGAALRGATAALAGARFLSIEGRARVAPEANDEAWAAIIEPERRQDPGRGGVAVIIDVDSVAGAGAGAEGFFQQARA